MKKIKIVLLCVFLISGKTTLLSKILIYNNFVTLVVNTELLPTGEFFGAKINVAQVAITFILRENSLLGLTKNIENLIN